MSLEGRLEITLGPGPARIASTRRPGLSRLMNGRTPDAALSLLPRLFALCGEAHRAASSLALSGHCTQAQMRLVRAEQAREHLLRLIMSWRAEDAPALPAPPVMALVGTARAGGDVARDLAAYLEAHVLGLPPEAFLETARLEDWRATAATAPARYLGAVIARGQAGLGALAPSFLPDLPEEMLTTRLETPAFAARPEWDGPRETGPLQRHHAHPLVASVVAEHGAGLLARLVARLVELASLPGALAAAQEVEITPGLGVVETARGRLIHAGRVENGQIVDYKIVAPTEWNFHPEGVAARALAGVSEDEAAAVIEAIDPCVDYQMRAA